MKKLSLVISMCFMILMCSNVLSVNAKEIGAQEEILTAEKFDVIRISAEEHAQMYSTRYVASCPDHDKHQMMPIGMAYVKNMSGATLWIASAHQCSCGHVVLVKDGYTSGGSIGYYYQAELSYTPSNPSVWYIDPDDIEYTSQSYLSGHTFY